MGEHKDLSKSCVCCGKTITNESSSENMCSECEDLYTSCKRIVAKGENSAVNRIKTILIGLDEEIKKSYLGFWDSSNKTPYYTDGVSHTAYDYQIPENKKIAHFQLWNVKLSIWTPKLFAKMFSPYISGAKFGIILFDMKRPRTLDELEKWIQLFRDSTSFTPSLLLVGYNYDKIDSEDFDEKLEKLTSAFIKKIGIDYYLKIYTFSQDITYLIFDKIIYMLLNDGSS